MFPGRSNTIAALVTTGAVVVAALMGTGSSSATVAAAAVVLPPVNVNWDYQIGGAFTPHSSVGVVSRDRNASPSPGDYNICYVNAFQTQPDEQEFWTDDPDHWALVLKDGDGQPVVDGAWGEFVLDTRTPATRSALMEIVGPWIDGCAADGFQATEFDNLDSFYRGQDLIEEVHNKEFAKLLTARSHAVGLAAAQKNWSEVSAQGPALGFDFAVAEECGQYNECGAYAAAYANRVYVVEYKDKWFNSTCSKWGSRLSVVRRNVDVTPGGINKRC